MADAESATGYAAVERARRRAALHPWHFNPVRTLSADSSPALSSPRTLLRGNGMGCGRLGVRAGLGSSEKAGRAGRVRTRRDPSSSSSASFSSARLQSSEGQAGRRVIPNVELDGTTMEGGHRRSVTTDSHSSRDIGMLPGVEVARRRRVHSPAQRRATDLLHGTQLAASSSTDGRASRARAAPGLAHHHHHHHHHHHYHHHPPRAAPSQSRASQARRLQDLLQEHRAVSSHQQGSNVGLVAPSEVGPLSSGVRNLRGLRGEESRLSRLAMLLRGQSSERRLQGAAREARDRLDERLRAVALVGQRRTTATVPGNALYDLSVLFSDEEEESLWSDDEDWERSMREWLAAWAPSLEDRWQPDLTPGNSRPVSTNPQPLKPREGLSKAAIEALRRVTFGGKREEEREGASCVGREQEDCPVCLERFLPGQALFALPCNHRFHPDCLTPWLQSHGQCPYCRAHIEGVPIPNLGRAGGSEMESSSQSDDFVSWMTALEQGMASLSYSE